MKIQMADGSIMEPDLESGTVLDVLDRLGINPVEVIVSVNGRLVPEDSIVHDNDELKIYRIVHGG
ncbi:MAG: MoaD/ThiS family protein [Methanoregulaceae archaeon]|nr:MoaD/ThiS family protein [Methanoregulaceae archaeon]